MHYNFSHFYAFFAHSVGCIWSEAQFPFAFISAQSAACVRARAGILRTLHLGAWSQSINWVLISEWVWVDTIEHIFTVQGSSSVTTGTLWGRGRMMDWVAVSQCHGPDGSRGGETSEDCPHHTCVLCLPDHHRTHPPSHFWGQKLISSLWALPTMKYSNWNWNNKHKHREGRQAAKCAESSIKPGPGNLVSWVRPLYSQSQELTFHLMKEDLNSC